MIDINELRRKVNSTDVVDHIDLHANIKPFLSEILDRIEAAEQTAQDCLRIDKEKAQIAQRLEAAEKERDDANAAAAGIALQGESKPAGFPGAQSAPSVPREAIEKMLTQLVDIAVSNGANSVSMPDEYVEVAAWLCGIPAQPAPSEQDESVRKSWARFSHELHRSPDAPYPGMSEAFEQHFSQSFTDREWRVEASAWAAAWKAAKRHGAQPAPSVPEAVMEVIAGLVYEVERNICPHEETHRGGQWEICDMCGAKWADDKGGKPEFKWPEVVEKARAMLAAAPEANS